MMDTELIQIVEISRGKCTLWLSNEFSHRWAGLAGADGGPECQALVLAATEELSDKLKAAASLGSWELSWFSGAQRMVGRKRRKRARAAGPKSAVADLQEPINV